MQLGASPQGRERQRSMWSVPIVVIHEHPDDPLEVLLVQNQQPVERVRTGGAHEPLGNPIGLWRAKRRTNDLNPVASEHVVTTVGEFLIPNANQKPHRFGAVRQRPRQVTSLLDNPWRGRIRGAPGHVHPTAAQVDDEGDVEPLQSDRLDGEEIDSQCGVGVPVRTRATSSPGACPPVRDLRPGATRARSSLRPSCPGPSVRRRSVDSPIAGSLAQDAKPRPGRRIEIGIYAAFRIDAHFRKPPVRINSSRLASPTSCCDRRARPCQRHTPSPVELWTP
jgi:hypothetical protein